MRKTTTIAALLVWAMSTAATALAQEPHADPTVADLQFRLGLLEEMVALIERRLESAENRLVPTSESHESRPLFYR